MPYDVPLATAGFDRAALHRTDEAWLADAWTRARVLLVSPGSATPIATDADGRFHAALVGAADVPADVPRRFLGVVGEDVFFTATVDADERRWLTLRDLGGSLGERDNALFATAIALEQWHQRHTHCPRCGAPTVEAQAGWTRTCTADGSEHFPRTDPAVIMLIEDGDDRVLLGRSHQWPEGRFSALAGFVEPGESLESAVAREVLEEVGVGVTDIRYRGSQPWPFPASLMLGFLARLDGPAGITVDTVELAEAGWFTRDEISRARDWTDEHVPAIEGTRLRAVPPRLSIARFLIDSWLAGE